MGIGSDFEHDLLALDVMKSLQRHSQSGHFVYSKFTCLSLSIVSAYFPLDKMVIWNANRAKWWCSMDTIRISSRINDEIIKEKHLCTHLLFSTVAFHDKTREDQRKHTAIHRLSEEIIHCIVFNSVYSHNISLWLKMIFVLGLSPPSLVRLPSVTTGYITFGDIIFIVSNG